MAEKGIRVNLVARGPIWTPLIPATFNEKQVAEFGSNEPLGRPGQPADHAGAYVLLASDERVHILRDDAFILMAELQCLRK